jgi:hypothetical protein
MVWVGLWVGSDGLSPRNHSHSHNRTPPPPNYVPTHRRQDWKGLRMLAGADNGLPVSKDLLDTAVTVAAKAGKTKTARALVDLMILRGQKVRPGGVFDISI